MNEPKPIPIMPVGKYAGKRVDTLPNSYLRWMISQSFPKELLDAAKEKLEKSDYNDLYIMVSRHAIDMFSKRFLAKWQKHVEDVLTQCGDIGKADGLGTFVAKYAVEAWENGEDVSKHRHQDDGISMLYGDITFVFNVNPDYPEYRDVVTIM